nr:MAG TPA: hypothetical protein [Caudoviricetes sp.]
MSVRVRLYVPKSSFSTFYALFYENYTCPFLSYAYLLPLPYPN